MNNWNMNIAIFCISAWENINLETSWLSLLNSLSAFNSDEFLMNDMLLIFCSSSSTVEFWWLISSDEDVVMNSTMRSLSSESLSDEFARVIKRSTTVIKFSSKSKMFFIELSSARNEISIQAEATKDDELSTNSMSENLSSREKLRVCEIKNFTDF